MVCYFFKFREGCPILSYNFVLLGHNTIRGAAGGLILNAELGMTLIALIFDLVVSH